MSAEGGRLADNVVAFARMLRRAGLAVGPSRVLDALRALAQIRVERRDEFYWALHAVFVERREQRELFDQAFRLFWRDPNAQNEALGLLLPASRAPAPRPDPTMRRVSEAWGPPPPVAPPAEAPPETTEVDMVMTFSHREQLRTRDFEQMTEAELRLARKLIHRLTLKLREVETRRYRSAARGERIDPRRSLRRSLASLDTIALARRERRRKPPPLVMLCDISGSMERYSRMFLHFMHALTNARDRVTSFTFGTRLTPITRALRHRDVDFALTQLGEEVADWSGGTRIGGCLRDFNRHWARRVLGQGAVVLLVTDGLDRDGEVDLGFEADRLHRSCRRLVWLNPLLRYDGFEPRASGIQRLLPHVDDFRSVHDLASLEQLAEALGDL